MPTPNPEWCFGGHVCVAYRSSSGGSTARANPEYKGCILDAITILLMVTDRQGRIVMAGAFIAAIAIGLGTVTFLASTHQASPLPEDERLAALLTAMTVVAAFVGSILGSVLLSWVRQAKK